MAEQLPVITRDQHGKHYTRRLRATGQIPAVLYGHGLESVSLAVSGDLLDKAVRHGARLVDLTGAVSESAFIRELQWDTYGTHVLHVDFTRVSADELVMVEVVVELRGEAPGVKSGGVVSQLIHQVELECPAASIPEKLFVNINSLKLNESITLSQLEIPAKSKLSGDPEDIVVECVVPTEVSDEASEAVPGEPEVIGGKKEESEDEG
jgi:large subunit ribosomal protein L25